MKKYTLFVMILLFSGCDLNDYMRNLGMKCESAATYSTYWTLDVATAYE